MKPRKAALLVALLGALAAVGAQPAFADSQIKASEVHHALGGRGGASATFQSWGEKFRLWDTGCDGHPVYIKYAIFTRFGEVVNRTFSWHGGCGTMGLKNLDLTEGTHIQYDVCVEVQLGLDACSFARQDDKA